MRPWIGEPVPLPPPDFGEVLDALDGARALLALQHDLAKGQAYAWVNGRGCFCIVAAITRASRTTQIRDAAMKAATLALQGRHWRSIESYNDAPTTSIDDAKTLVLRAKSNVGAVIAA